MTANGWLQILVSSLLVFLVTKPLGIFMARVFSREKTFLDPVLRPMERLLYRLTGGGRNHEMRWTEYAWPCCCSAASPCCCCICSQRVQHWLPWNPQNLQAVSPGDLAFNTAASFTTNTNWQNYVGETTMSYLTQMAGLAYHNFVSARPASRWPIAFIRGIARRESEDHRQLLGGFGPRARFWVLLPLCAGGRAGPGFAGSSAEPAPYDTCEAGGAHRFHNWTDGKPHGPTASRDGHRTNSHRARAGRLAGDHQGCSAPTAAASSTPTARIRSRIPRHSAIFCEMLLHFLPSRAGLTYTLGRMTGFASVMAGQSGRHGHPVSSPALRTPTGRRLAAIRCCMACDQHASPTAIRRQHGGQRSPLRHRQLRPLRHRHHRRQLRRGQLACTIPSRRSAAWFRWSISCSAR